jgi:DNA-binding NtrC family response regulator
MQVKLLRALQEKTVRKVGGSAEEAVDVRIIAASNRDLEEAVARGELREDLFYRINVIPIRLPPLRERREDIPLLVDFFLDKYAHELGVAPKRVSIEAMRALEAYHWPGNVRELENVIERTLTLAPGETMRRDDLPPQVLSSRRGGPGGVELPEEGIDLEAYLDEVRADLMRQALERSEGVQTRAAELLGTSFRSFRYYARKAGIRGGEEEGDGAGDGEGGSPTRG